LRQTISISHSNHASALRDIDENDENSNIVENNESLRDNQSDDNESDDYESDDNESAENNESDENNKSDEDNENNKSDEDSDNDKDKKSDEYNEVKLYCPYPDCKQGAPYAQKWNLLRHFRTRTPPTSTKEFTKNVSQADMCCRAACYFCKMSWSTVTIRTYELHVDKCRKKNKGLANFAKRDRKSKKRLQILRNKNLRKLRKLSRNASTSDGAQVGTNRKSDTALPPSQGQPGIVRDNSVDLVANVYSNLSESTGGLRFISLNVIAILTWLLVWSSLPVQRHPQWAEQADNNATQVSAVAHDLANVQSIYGQQTDLRAPFVGTHTLDWSHSCGATDPLRTLVSTGSIGLQGTRENCDLGLPYYEGFAQFD